MEVKPPALTAPLSCRTITKPRLQRLENFLIWIPLLGWIAALILQEYRLSRIYRTIADQLCARPDFSEETWRALKLTLDPREICAVVRDAYEWPNEHFEPCDPAAIALYAWDDGIN